MNNYEKKYDRYSDVQKNPIKIAQQSVLSKFYTQYFH